MIITPPSDAASHQNNKFECLPTWKTPAHLLSVCNQTLKRHQWYKSKTPRLRVRGSLPRYGTLGGARSCALGRPRGRASSADWRSTQAGQPCRSWTFTEGPFPCLCRTRSSSKRITPKSRQMRRASSVATLSRPRSSAKSTTQLCNTQRPCLPSSSKQSLTM